MNNSKEVIRGDKIYVFVTRGRSKKFSEREIASYFEEEIQENSTEEWQIPNNRQRQIMFMRDLKKGLDWCATKYVRPAEDIVREARRLAPHVRI